jgi:hypothetical protein
MTIVIKLAGGVGNQLFQYCLGRRLADKNNDRLLLDTSYYQKAKHCKYELDRFNIRVDNPVPEDNSRQYQIIQENTMSFIPEVLELKGDIILQGYWQSPRYIENYIIRELIPTQTLSNPLWDKSKATAIHVRGNDYKGWKKFDVCTYNYYNQAVKYIKENSETELFVVYTDDVEYAKYMLWDVAQDTQVIYAPSNGVYDILEIAGYKNIIASNSTFAWWGYKFGSHKISIFPSKWFNNVGDGQNEQINLYEDKMILIEP